MMTGLRNLNFGFEISPPKIPGLDQDSIVKLFFEDIGPIIIPSGCLFGITGVSRNGFNLNPALMGALSRRTNILHEFLLKIAPIVRSIASNPHYSR
jgi:hypothetical protein